MTTNIHDYYYNIVSKQHTSEMYAQAEQARLVKSARTLARQQRREARAARRTTAQSDAGTARSWSERWESFRSRFGSGDAAVEPTDKPAPPVEAPPVEAPKVRERVH